MRAESADMPGRAQGRKNDRTKREQIKKRAAEEKELWSDCRGAYQAKKTHKTFTGIQWNTYCTTTLGGILM